jgi:hypothetical protein
MKVEVGNIHDSCVATYQTLEANQLNVALRENGISAPEVRRAIIEHDLFSSGYFRDSCWFEEQGRKFRPVMCFEEAQADGKVGYL